MIERTLRRYRQTSFSILLLALLGTPGTSFMAPPAYGQEIDMRIDLPAGDLGQSLILLADQFGVNVIAPEPLVRNRYAPSVSGTMGIGDALTKLLADSGLEATRNTSGAFLVSESSSISERNDAGRVAPDNGAAKRRASANQSTIETIVVTGERVDRSLTDTISSVAVLTESMMEDSVILDIDELLQRVPNVNILPDGFALSFRGISQVGIGNGTLDPVAPTSAIYIDGAVQTRAAVGNGALSTWDLAQVEVFRGPQTATQGRSGLAGAMVMNTANPGNELNGRIRLLANDTNRQQYSVAVGGPLIEGVLGARVAAEIIDNDGFIEFDSGGVTVDDVGRNNRDFVRTKLRFTPTERFEAILGVTYVDGERGSNAVNGPDLFAGKTNTIVNINNTETVTGSLSINYKVSDAWSIRATTGFNDLDGESDVEQDTLIAEQGLSTPNQIIDRTLSQEVQLTYDADGPLRGIAGFYYAEVEERQQAQFFGTTSFGILGTFFVDGEFSNDLGFENYSLYGQMEYDFSKRLSLIVGGRIEYEERTFQLFDSAFYDPPSQFLQSGENFFEGKGDDTAFLPMVGLTYHINDRYSISATFQQAYRPGGTDINELDNEAVQFDPELTDNYDLAFRASLFDDQLLVNVNAFYIDYTDMQIRVVPLPEVPIFRFVDNAGEANLYGVEIESLWNLNERWSLYASGAYQKSELVDFVLRGTDDVSGDEFNGSPPVSAAFGGTWRHPDGWTGTVDVVYSGEYFSGLPNIEAGVVDAYTIVGGRFGYRSATWAAYLYGENILDEDYLLSSFTGQEDPAQWTGVLGQPQTFGVIFEASF
ncbi:MAG: TonB-dependent receptor [Pseudomonadota bacterium]